MIGGTWSRDQQDESWHIEVRGGEGEGGGSGGGRIQHLDTGRVGIHSMYDKLEKHLGW